jgi:hypothetical protein
MDQLWGKYPANRPMFTILEAHLKRMLESGEIIGSLDGNLNRRDLKEDGLAVVAKPAHKAIRSM